MIELLISFSLTALFRYTRYDSSCLMHSACSNMKQLHSSYPRLRLRLRSRLRYLIGLPRAAFMCNTLRDIIIIPTVRACKENNSKNNNNEGVLPAIHFQLFLDDCKFAVLVVAGAVAGWWLLPGAVETLMEINHKHNSNL